jgi:hypothetical protein
MAGIVHLARAYIDRGRVLVTWSHDCSARLTFGRFRRVSCQAALARRMPATHSAMVAGGRTERGLARRGRTAKLRSNVVDSRTALIPRSVGSARAPGAAAGRWWSQKRAPWSNVGGVVPCHAGNIPGARRLPSAASARRQPPDGACVVRPRSPLRHPASSGARLLPVVSGRTCDGSRRYRRTDLAVLRSSTTRPAARHYWWCRPGESGWCHRVARSR